MIVAVTGASARGEVRMNAFEKLAFERMSSFDRCNLGLAKGLEFFEVAKLLTNADMELLDILGNALQKIKNAEG